MADSLREVLRDARAALALRLARQAGRMLARAFRDGVDARGKAAGGKGDLFDPVTEADRAAERLLREGIAASFAADGFIGEEFGASAGISAQGGGSASGFVWVLDPIDGTRNFICGLPGWTVLIGLLRDGEPVMGVMHEPLSDTTIIGTGRPDGGGGCWRLVADDAVEDAGAAVRLRVRQTARLAQAFCGTTLPRLYDTPGRAALLAALQRRARHVQFDADALFYGALAQGRLDVALDTRLALHDTVALLPIVRGAGGIVSDWRGGGGALPGGDIVACATPALHEEMLALLQETGAAAESAAEALAEAATSATVAAPPGDGENG